MPIISITSFLTRGTLMQLSKMSAEGPLTSLKATAKVTKETITSLKNELNALNNDYNQLRAQQLREENRKLEEAVEAAKQRLIHLEVANGIKQVPLPNHSQSVQCSISEKSEIPAATATPIANANEKKDKKPKAAKETQEKQQPDEAVDIGRLDLRIAKIVEVQKHPDADTLYLLKVDAGEGKPRTVCSGLVKHIAMQELHQRSVMLLCNLKPAKMRGIISEAMVMCASSPEAVEVLQPPKDCNPGDLVECQGFQRRPDAVMNPKKKIFESVSPDLSTNEQLQACYKGVPLNVPGKGFILAQTLKNVAVK